MRKTSQKGYLLDTTVFNDILDDNLSADLFANSLLFVTHIQLDQIDRTSNEIRKNQLLRTFKMVSAEKLPTASAVFDVSRWDEASWSDGVLFQAILDKLQATDGKRKAKNYTGQLADGLIAETAIRQNLTLVTNDQNLSKVTKEFGGEVVSLEQFVALRN